MQTEKNKLFPPKKKEGEGEASASDAPKEVDKAQQYKDRRKDVTDRLAEARHAKKMKLEELKKMRSQISGSVSVDSKDYLKQLDGKIK